MTERVQQCICIKFCVKLEHSSMKTIRMTQKAYRNNAMSPAQVKVWHKYFKDSWESRESDDLPPLQPRFGALRLLAFPKTKITFEREKISDCRWNSGKYDEATDGDSNKGFCTVFWTGEETLGGRCEFARCLLWRGLRCHCPMYNVSCILYLLQ